MRIFLTIWLWEMLWTALFGVAFDVLDYALLAHPSTTEAGSSDAGTVSEILWRL